MHINSCERYILEVNGNRTEPLILVCRLLQQECYLEQYSWRRLHFVFLVCSRSEQCVSPCMRLKPAASFGRCRRDSLRSLCLSVLVSGGAAPVQAAGFLTELSLHAGGQRHDFDIEASLLFSCVCYGWNQGFAPSSKH